MTPLQAHLIRHGEVHNPESVLYGRLPGFGLSDQGRIMADRAAKFLHENDIQVSRIISSPLQRTKESAEPVAKLYGLDIEEDVRLIEPWNIFEGSSVNAKTVAKNLPKVLMPWKPSWGEAYTSIRDRMLDVIQEALNEEAAKKQDGKDWGHVVFVSHQLPIWMIRRSLAGKSLVHNPKHRELALSSITTVENHDHGLAEVAYHSPAAEFLLNVSDKGAV